ncbi:hypothetical protein NC651_037115 [Populus alba x Populus x berolinensis]|nr:hypothetical protein NC651_037115 [Populus alba x Populus x berolinensis]
MEGDVPLYSSIADSNIDLEFMMDSEINRILNAGSRPVVDGAFDPEKPVFGGAAEIISHKLLNNLS